MPSPRLLLALALLLGCGGTGTTATTSASTATGTSGAGGGGASSCLSCGAPVATGTISSGKLTELSGLVASLAHPGVTWVHNDSGDSPRFFAIDAAGKRLATIDVTGAFAVDWEDIARGPCPAGTCIYLGDIGDNKEERTTYTLYRVLEPAVVTDSAVTAEAFPFTYPDGPHNAETLLVHPTTGAVTIVTKVSSGASSMYEFPLPLTPGVPVVLKPAGTLAPPAGSPKFTGGDVHPAAEGVLLRTYTSVWFFPQSPGESVASALGHAPCLLPTPDEPQGEAIGWLPDGKGYVTVSEGAGADVNRVTCNGP